MAALFSYKPRTGRLVGSAAGQHFDLLAQRLLGAQTQGQQSRGIVREWSKEGDLRPGKWTPSDYTFEMPDHPGPNLGSLRLSILTEADRVRLAASGGRAISDCLLAHQGALVLAEHDQGACLVHGWPPCRSAHGSSSAPAP